MSSATSRTVDKTEFFREARDDLNGPLHGIVVLEATTTWAGPMAGCVLADFGARVIKVEHPAGEVGRKLRPLLPESGLSLPHETVNRNKESLTANLSTPGGRDAFLTVARGADVVIENFRPGTMQAWGVGYDAVRAVNPAIVYVSVSGFGQFGPLSPRVAYDPIAQSYSGFASVNGAADGAPVKAATFLGDDLAGVHAALGALAALNHRARTGEGQHVDVALVDAMLFQSNGFLTAGAMGVDVPRLGNQFAVSAPTNMYPCSDGWVYAGVLMDVHWQRLARLMGGDELANDPRYAALNERLAHRDDVDTLLAEWCSTRSVADVTATFESLGLPATRVNSYAEAAAEPHVAARDMLQSTQLQDGSQVPLVGPAAKFSRTPIRVRAATEALGASTDAILREFGYDDQAIAALRRDGAI